MSIKMSTKMSWTLKKKLNNFGIKNGWPARAARNRKPPRPIFDDKKCLINLFLMSGTFFWHFLLTFFIYFFFL